MTNPELAPEAGIVSSTGQPGLFRRSYGRLYANATRFSDDPNEVEVNFQRLVSIGDRFSSRIGRVVFKGVVNDPVRLHTSNSGLRSALEVALPLDEFGQPGDHLIYLANNQSERQPLTPIEEMVQATTTYPENYIDPVQRIETVKQEGYSFTTDIKDDEVESVLSLWGSTFDWTRDGVIALAARLKDEMEPPPKQRTVWYSAIKDQDTIVALAMAERLSMPTSNGNLEIVESTEWRVHDDYSKKGLMVAVLTHLNAQILSDFYENGQNIPLICAECNFQTRSDWAGFKAGFRIPPRDIRKGPPAQILVQNVAVGDGQDWPADKLRDFSFMYLPVEQIVSSYSQAQVARILTVAS